MKRKDELKIEILSNIKDEIIDKQSAKRYTLMNKKRKPKWIIPSSVAAVLLIAIMIPLFIVLFSKQVPIYEGMSVLSNYQPSKDTASSGGVTTLLAGGSGRTQIDFLNDDNGNHYGQNKKPVEDIVEDDSSISLTVPDQQMYYAKPNQDIYINIHFSNPDDFVILSFVFNGKTYSSYMFEEGSDMENIIIKCSIGDVEGIVEYTIDAIKYVDGTAIKDVIMQGDKTIKVGVYSADKQPTAQITDELIGINDISFTASINDRLDLIRMSGGEVFAVLCDDDTVIAQQKLTVGENNVKFEGLTKDTTYRYAIIANYDSLDGTGFNTYVIYEKEITTKKIVAFDSVIIGQESISFGLVWEESFENKVLQSLTLYKGEEIIQELDVKATSISGLLSNNEYRLVAAYVNKGQTETSDMTFTTKAKATPDIIITESSKTQTSLGFDISVTDVDNVGTITKLDLIHGEDVQNITDLSTREFTDLLSDNTYTVKVTYTYDLNDGVGSQTTVKTLDITTEVKAEPIFTFKNMASETYSLGGEYDITNIDNTLISYKVELYLGSELVKENTDKKIDFDSLDYYTDYTVKITYTFDVNDGKGVQTKKAEQAFKTHPYLDATSLAVRSTGIVYDGDKIYLQIGLNNPNGATVKTITVNGGEYEVNTSTTDILLVEIENHGQFASGDITLTLEGLSFTLDGKDYTAVSETRCSDIARVVTRVNVVSVECVDANLTPSSWVPQIATKEEYKRFLLVTLGGEQLNDVKHVSLNIQDNYLSNNFEFTPAQIQQVDGCRFLIAIPDLSDDMPTDDPWGLNVSATVDLLCGNAYVENYTVSATASPFHIINSFITVSTTEEFLNLNNSVKPVHVELTADLDFSDVENFNGILRFNGMFDGNGHTISNLSFIGTKTDNGLVGLFQNFSGELCDLTLDDSLYIGVSGSVGGLVGNLEYGEIKNCTVGEGVTISATGYVAGGILGAAWGNARIINCENYATVAADASNVGGILGTGDATVSGCRNYGTISSRVRDTHTYVGGIVGCGCVVKECINYGSVESYGVAGGIVGFGDYSVGVQNCINYGTIIGGWRAGGIAGYTDNGANVDRCLNTGSVIYTEIISTDSCAGGIIGWDDDGAVFNCINVGEVQPVPNQSFGAITGTWWIGSNCFGLIPYFENDPICTVDQLNSKEFYTETLGWSEEIWDFSELDVENGKYPKLK